MEQNDVRYFYVSNHTGATGVGSGNRISDYSNLSDGEVVVTNAEGVVMTDANIGSNDSASNNGVQIVFKTGDEIYRSPLLKSGNLLSYNGTSYSAAQNQITYVGYDTSGNSMDITGGDVASVRVEFYEDNRQGFANPMLVDPAYTISASDTQFDVAIGLADGLQRIFNRQQTKPIKTEVVINHDSGTAAAINTLSVTNGEQYVETSETLSSGLVLRMGGTGSSYPVYKIVAAYSSNDWYKLDRPYEGSDATLGTGSWEYITGSDAEAADAGIKLTGLDKKFKVGRYNYGVHRFDVNTYNLGSTPVTDSQDADPGVGTYKEVAENEWFYQGNEGNIYRGDFMHEIARSDAKSGNTYDQLSVRCYNDQETSSVGYVRSPIEVVVALKSGFAADSAPDIVVNALDTYFGLTSGLSA